MRFMRKNALCTANIMHTIGIYANVTIKLSPVPFMQAFFLQTRRKKGYDLIQ